MADRRRSKTARIARRRFAKRIKGLVRIPASTSLHPRCVEAIKDAQDDFRRRNKPIPSASMIRDIAVAQFFDLKHEELW